MASFGEWMEQRRVMLVGTWLKIIDRMRGMRGGERCLEGIAYVGEGHCGTAEAGAEGRAVV